MKVSEMTKKFRKEVGREARGITYQNKRKHFRMFKFYGIVLSDLSINNLLKLKEVEWVEVTKAQRFCRSRSTKVYWNVTGAAALKRFEEKRTERRAAAWMF